MAAKSKQFWRQEYFQTAVAVVLIIIVVFGFWYGLRYGLNTDYPMLAVASGSMSTAQPDNNWQTVFYAFSPTLHTGDLIIVEAVNAHDIHAAPFNASGSSGDILVFHNPENPDELIVHRAIGWYDNTTVITQGDGNPVPGPPSGGKVPVNMVIGKVIMRVPWIGYLALFMQNPGGVYLLIALIIIIVAIELVLSTYSSGKAKKTPEQAPPEIPPET